MSRSTTRLPPRAAKLLAFVLIAAAVLVLGPTAGTVIDLNIRITSAKATLEANNTKLAAMLAEQAQWKDAAWVAQQARDRMGYALPGDEPRLTYPEPTPTPTP